MKAKLSPEDYVFFKVREPKCRFCGTTKVGQFTRGGPLLDFETDANGNSIWTGPHINTCPKINAMKEADDASDS